jgi:hypothetical protein
MSLKVGQQLDTSPWIPMRDMVDGECPECGFEGPHSVEQSESGDMRGRCNECYAMFTVEEQDEKD